MLRIRQSTREVDVEGTPEDLRELRKQVLALALAARGQASIKAEGGYDPKPYDRVLDGAVIHVGSGPTMVSVTNDGQLTIVASPDNLRRLASFIVVPSLPKEGWHSHYEYFVGNEYIMPTSEPVVFSLRRPSAA